MSDGTSIEKLIRQLSDGVEFDNVTNPYLRPELASNLREYLSLLMAFPYSGHLLVGEAPGYKGCAQSGIPFTSQRIINERSHPFISTLRTRIRLSGNETEASSTKVWNQLEGKMSVPAFWNTFPFHPWQPGYPTRNRAPNEAEKATGVAYLDLVVDILKPHTVVAVGGVARALLRGRYPALAFHSFGHPSMRGYDDFVAGFNRLGLE